MMKMAISIQLKSDQGKGLLNKFGNFGLDRLREDPKAQDCFSSNIIKKMYWTFALKFVAL